MYTHFLWLKNRRFIPFTSSLVQSFYFTLLLSTAGNLCFVSKCWRSPRPCVITQWLTDWQALLSRPSRLQVNPNSWTVMDGSWHRTDSNWRETELTWVLCHYCPSAKRFGGHCRSLDLRKQAPLPSGEVLSNKGVDSCGLCIEVINRSEVECCVGSYRWWKWNTLHSISSYWLRVLEQVTSLHSNTSGFIGQSPALNLCV